MTKYLSIMKLHIVTLLLFCSIKLNSQQSVVIDKLKSEQTVQGEFAKKNHGGSFSSGGWKAIQNGDYLMIEIDTIAGFEGELEVKISELDWEKMNSKGARKVHFISMFSNPVADHHLEDGGTENDALWSLRAGSSDEGTPRYGQNFKILWASKGAKRSLNSDYHEKIVKLPEGWRWDKDTYIFKVSWSKREKVIQVFLNNEQVFSDSWKNQVSPLRYIYLAKSPDFHTLVGPVFSDLKINTN
jgi:hypothetical protein